MTMGMGRRFAIWYLFQLVYKYKCNVQLQLLLSFVVSMSQYQYVIIFNYIILYYNNIIYYVMLYVVVVHGAPVFKRQTSSFKMRTSI